MEELHPDKISYEIIWNEIINKELYNYQSIYGNCIKFIPNIKEEIWKKYVSLNNYCKTNYMKSAEGKIDRHKVAACYMISIASLRPMRFTNSFDNFEIYPAINETLAITVGLSLVRAFAIASIKENNNINKEEADALIEKFKNGIKIPTGDLINHGTYLDNYANEIYFSISEGKMSILSLANELYLLEVITKIS